MSKRQKQMKTKTQIPVDHDDSYSSQQAALAAKNPLPPLSLNPGTVLHPTPSMSRINKKVYVCEDEHHWLLPLSVKVNINIKFSFSKKKNKKKNPCNCNVSFFLKEFTRGV